MLTRLDLIRRSIFHYWRTNLAVMLGVMIGTAVISGALIVGDSVRSSLKQMTLDRLGKVDLALTGSRFFRQELSHLVLNKLQEEPAFAAAGDSLKVAPAILATGSLQTVPSNDEETSDGESKTPESEHFLATVGQADIVGLDEELWSMLGGSADNLPLDNAIVLNSRIASQLDAKVGDELRLFVDVPQTIPQESLLGERDVDELVVEVQLQVSHIIEADQSLGRFSMQPNQQLPLTAFVNLELLQTKLDLDELPASFRNPVARPARINSLMFQIRSGDESITEIDESHANRATEILQQQLTLEDLHLNIRPVEDHGYFALESNRMILEKAFSEQAIETANQLGLPTSPVLVYLANEIANASHPERFSMYSIAAGVKFTQAQPFGPFRTAEGNILSTPPPGSAVINDWLAKDLNVDAGDEITLKYHVVGSRGDLPEEEIRLKVAGVVPLESSVADDRGFTPHVPGITDAETFADWKQPFPMDTDRITDRDDEYWKGSEQKPEGYRATPKLFVSLEEGRELWQSRYGDSTSVRIATGSNSLEESQAKFTQQFLSALQPTSLGLVVLPVKWQGLQAAQGTQDFSGMFIGFSFFVIAAAVVLISLLFRLGLENRVTETGLLTAVGMNRRSVQNLFLLQAIVIAVIGVAIGTFLAVGYAQAMIYGLTTWWRGAIGTSFLEVDVQSKALMIGAAIAILLPVPVLWLGLRELLSIPGRDRLLGVASKDNDKPVRVKRGGVKWWIGIISVGIAVILGIGVLLGLVPQTEAFGGFNWRIVSFFTGGFLSLIGLLCLFVVFLRNPGTSTLSGNGASGAAQLGMRNIARQRQRSATTVILVAFATFVVVAVAAGRQNPTQFEPDRNSGNGGFRIVAESARPVLYDLTTAEGQSKAGLISEEDSKLKEILADATLMRFRLRPGEDASCLNLYQTRLPTILGVPDAMIERGGFAFADTPGENPWEMLRGKKENGDIPVMGDMNTLQYSLHVPIGGQVKLPEDLGHKNDLEVVGSLAGSVFQGVLLMSEENFLELFPDIEGYRYFLIETDAVSAPLLTGLLETRLITFGFDAEPIGERLANFLAVQNTYLSTFQALGGLGLLLGTIGLGTVMLRNVIERRPELALMRAIGFSRTSLAIMILTECAMLLLIGLGIGALTAIWAMLPNTLSRGAAVPWGSGSALILGVFLTGMIAALAAVLEAVRTPILKTLRGE